MTTSDWCCGLCGHLLLGQEGRRRVHRAEGRVLRVHSGGQVPFFGAVGDGKFLFFCTELNMNVKLLITMMMNDDE